MILPFSTTLYTIEDNKEGSVNYLGVGEYVQYWTDKLFPQFTVLTNNPREHGILCAILKFMKDHKVENKRTNFRDFEAFWGLVLTSQPDLASPINVTKYQKVLEGRDSLSVKDVRKSRNIYNRLGYGLYGFYINPSVKWHLVMPDKFNLTPSGEKLANYFLKDLGLEKYFSDWNKGKSFKFDELDKLADSLQVNLPAEELGKEKKIWEQAIEYFFQHFPEVKDPWLVNLSELGLDELRSDSGSYGSFLPSIHEKYIAVSQENLAHAIQCLIHLERSLAISEFIFDFEYLARCQYKPSDFKFEISDNLKSELMDNLSTESSKYIDMAIGSKVFPPLKENVSSYDEYLSLLIKRHIKVQTYKNKAIYMNEREILSIGEVNPNKLKAILNEPEEKQLQEIFFQYRKDWHFNRFLKYYRYMC